MTRLMRDYFRRWWRVLALVGLAEFGLGMFITGLPQVPFEFWAFMVAMWAGAVLLSFDLRRGALRPTAVLPLTGPEISRAWWLATVPLPAVVLAALLFLGAALACGLNPGQDFPARSLLIASLFNTAWVGIEFTMNFNPTSGLGESWRGMLGSFVVSALCIILFFGSLLFCQGASTDPWRAGVLLAGGAVMTLVGWYRAEHFDPGRAWIYLGGSSQPNVERLARLGQARLDASPTPLALKTHAAKRQTPAGYGGLAFLLNHSCLRVLAYLVSMLALMALFWSWQPQALPSASALLVFAGTGAFMVCGFILIFGLMPVLRHLRLLRTLPISTNRLAFVLLALLLLPLLAAGLLAAAVAWLFLGKAAALVFLKSYAFNLAPGAMCVFLATWLGEGILAYALLAVTLFGSLQVLGWLQLALHSAELPFAWVALSAAATLPLAWLLTLLALVYSRRAYCVRVNPAGSFPWGSGR